MQQKKPLLILLLVFVLLLSGAMIAYRYLSDQYPDGMLSDTDPSVTDSADPTNPADPADTTAIVDAVDFTVYNADGTEVHLSDFYGKPILINFWATWCSPCKSELPDFDAVYRDYGEDVVFMMVNMTSGRDTVESASAFVADAGYTFPVYYDKDLDAASTYGAYSIPMTILIDADAHIVGGQVGVLSEEVLRGVLDDVLQPQS